MTKRILALAAGLAFALPMAASAATISNPLFSNGDTTIDANGGATVSGTFALTVGQNEVCEVIRTQSDPSQAPTDTSVGGALGYQEGYYSNVQFTVKAPPNTSTVFPTVQCAGIFGGIRSINGADNVVVGPTGLGTLRVVANASILTGGTPLPSGDLASLLKMIADLTAEIAALKNPPAPTPAPAPAKPACPPSGDTSMVQSWLMANGYASGFYAVGVHAPTGHWGPVTTAAYAQAEAACK